MDVEGELRNGDVLQAYLLARTIVVALAGHGHGGGREGCGNKFEDEQISWLLRTILPKKVREAWVFLVERFSERVVDGVKIEHRNVMIGLGVRKGASIIRSDFNCDEKLDIARWLFCMVVMLI